MTKYILTHYKKEIEHSELDFTVRERFLGNQENEDWWDYISITKSENNFWSGESTEMDIDLAISTLQELKGAGCNFVEIMHHGDHHGYVFVGADIRLATDKEIADFEKKVEDHGKKQKDEEIKNLEKKLKELKDENG